MAKTKPTKSTGGRPRKPEPPSRQATQVVGEVCRRCGGDMQQLKIREDRPISGQIAGFVFSRVQHWAARCTNPACQQCGTIRVLIR